MRTRDSDEAGGVDVRRAGARPVHRHLVCLCALMLLHIGCPSPLHAASAPPPQEGPAARLSLRQDVYEGPMLPDAPEASPEDVDGPRRCAECDGLCDTWYMAHERVHCSEECAGKSQRQRKHDRVRRENAVSTLHEHR
jgi:hypothetical protein